MSELEELIARGRRAATMLAPYSAATIHEAYGRRGALLSDIKPISVGMRICASALTVCTTPGNNLPLHQAIYQAPPGCALLVATGGNRDFGYWGEIMTTAAINRELAGLVFEGGVRDLRELRALAWPVFAANVSLRGTIKVDNGELGETTSIGGVVVNCGDVVVGDDDGVVAVKLADAERVAALAGQRAAKEQSDLGQLQQGVSTLQLYDLPSSKLPNSSEGASDV